MGRVEYRYRIMNRWDGVVSIGSLCGASYGKVMMMSCVCFLVVQIPGRVTHRSGQGPVK